MSYWVWISGGTRLDLADGTLCLPDEVRIGLAGRKPPYRSTIQEINLNGQHVVIPVGRSTEVRIGIGPPKTKLWVRRDVAWVPTVTSRPGQIKYLQLTNLSDSNIILGHGGASFGVWMESDTIP